MSMLFFARVRSGLTQQQLAVKAGVSRRTVCALEQGEHLPTLRVGLKLCRALGCALEEVFGDALLS